MNSTAPIAQAARVGPVASAAPLIGARPAPYGSHMKGRTGGSEWVGGRVLMPAYVVEAEPFRPELILWLELPADLVVGSQLLDPKKPAVHLGDTLLAAMARPTPARLADRDACAWRRRPRRRGP